MVVSLVRGQATRHVQISFNELAMIQEKLSADSLIGTVLDGTHRIERLLSHGGMAAVYEARQLRLDRRVAVKVPEVKESTALGAALCAGLGAGIYEDLAATAAEVVRFERTFRPSASAHATYTTLFDQWHAVYGRFLEMGDAGLLRPLWKPAGA